MKKQKLFTIIFFLIVANTYAQKSSYNINSGDFNYNNSIMSDTIEILDSATFYMRVDSELIFTDKVFWDTMFFFYYKFNTENKPIRDSFYSLINTYNTGKKELWDKTQHFYDERGRLIHQREYKKEFNYIDTLEFDFFYNEFDLVDSITLHINYYGTPYLARTDYYKYDDKNRVVSIDRYISDEEENWFLAIVWSYFYNYEEVDKPSMVFEDDYYNGEILISQYDSFFYNKNTYQLDSLYGYFQEGSGIDNFILGSKEKYFYSAPYQEFADSVRNYIIVDGIEDFNLVVYNFKRKIPTKLNDFEIESFDCIMPNPYRDGQTIKFIDKSNVVPKDAKISIYSMKGNRILQLPYSDTVNVNSIGKPGEYVLTLSSANGEILYSTTFIYIN